jgi:hypothetical protein
MLLRGNSTLHGKSGETAVTITTTRYDLLSFPFVCTDPWLQVKRSRQQLRAEQKKQDQLCSIRLRENQELESEAHLLHRDAKILIKAISKPNSLSREELERVKLMMLEEQAKDANSATPPSASALRASFLEDSMLFPVK